MIGSRALDPQVWAALAPQLAAQRIYWLTILTLLADLVTWYRTHPHQTTLRHSLVGDFLHLLVGFCGLSLPATALPLASGSSGAPQG